MCPASNLLAGCVIIISYYWEVFKVELAAAIRAAVAQLVELAVQCPKGGQFDSWL